MPYLESSSLPLGRPVKVLGTRVAIGKALKHLVQSRGLVATVWRNFKMAFS
jgi:hypothetical protein